MQFSIHMYEHRHRLPCFLPYNVDSPLPSQELTPGKRLSQGKLLLLVLQFVMYMPWLGKTCSIALWPFSFSNLAPVASNQGGHQMCAHLQTVCWDSLEVEQACGVISLVEGVHFDELRFP